MCGQIPMSMVAHVVQLFGDAPSSSDSPAAAAMPTSMVAHTVGNISGSTSTPASAPASASADWKADAFANMNKNTSVHNVVPAPSAPMKAEAKKEKKTYKIVMIRHGESEWNKENRFCGWFDAGLSEKGWKRVGNQKLDANTDIC